MDVFILSVIKIDWRDEVTEDELNVFYLLDSKQYLVKNNPILKKILNNLTHEYHEKDVQRFINKLISWYTVKYSDNFLDSYLQKSTNVDLSILDIMSFDVLMKSFCSFEDDLFDVNTCQNLKIILLKHLVVMAGWGLIYSKKTSLEYGYYRASQLLQDFNSFYSWNLIPDAIYLPTLEKDYSPDNEENKKLIEKKRRHSDKKIKKRRKFLFHW